MKAAFYIFAVAFLISTVFVAPFVKDKKATGDLLDMATQNFNLQKQLADKSPKLDGFVDQWMMFVRPGETNTTIIPQIHINNFGDSGSLAESFRLNFFLATNDIIEAKPIDIPDYYQWQSMKGDQITVFRLSRRELIAEKAGTAIEPGFGPRGWLAFTVPRILSQTQLTNYHFVISFLDAAGNKTFVTNGFWKGKLLTNSESFDIPRTLAGSVNLVYTNYQLQSRFTDGWLPPELPPGCTNVIVYFGSQPFAYSRRFAEISSDSNGMEFAIKDLPDYFLKNLDAMPGYTPRTRNIWLKRVSMDTSIGGKTFSYPIQPVIISNRLYVEVEVPFSNDRKTLAMNDSFDSSLPIPRLWDRNYSTNYDEYGNGMYDYEVVNELTNPVLQVAYVAPNVVLVNGIFKVDENSIYAAFGQPPALITFSNSVAYDLETTQRITTISLQSQSFSEILMIRTNDTPTDIGEMWTNEFYRPIFQYQRPIFKYPSNRHLGEFREWADETNRSVTNIDDKTQ